MDEDEEKLFDSFTDLQRKFAINRINGRTKKQAYFLAGGRAKSVTSVTTAINSLVTNCDMVEFISKMMKKAASIQLCTSADIVDALMAEAGIKKDRKGKKIPPPPDSKQSSRVTALNKLSDYTGDFDRNTHKTEHSGYIERPLSELYDDDDEPAED